MKSILNLLFMVILGFALYPMAEEYIPGLDIFDSTPVVQLTKPENTYGFDTKIPDTVRDKETAHKLAGLFTGIADVLSHDADRTKPEVKYTANIRDIFHQAVTIEFDGKKLNDAANGLGDVIGPVLEKDFPDGSVELDSAARKKASNIFRAAAYGCALVK